MTETGSIHSPSEAGPATIEEAATAAQGGTTTDDDRPTEADTDHDTAPGLWDAPGGSHDAKSGPAANQADGLGETHPGGEDFRTANRQGAETTRKPFRPLRLTPYDDNGNKIAGWGRRIGAFAIDWGSLAVIELIFLAV